MKLDLEPDEYRKLIDLAYLGEWMINAHHDTDYQDDAADHVLQRLLSATGLPDADQDPETGEFFMKSDWVERLYDAYIMDYDDHVFWDELTERLAQRDLARIRGVSPNDINRDDDLVELKPLEERYRTELEERGIDRLEISSEY
jgi:hypothetical protein